MRKIATIAAVVMLAVLPSACGKDKVDVNPGKGDDGVGSVKQGDQGDKDSGKKE